LGFAFFCNRQEILECSWWEILQQLKFVGKLVKEAFLWS
jgi:hypothetical protein